MPGRVARVAPSSFYDDVSSDHETLPTGAETRVRVAVAATEAPAEDAEHNRVMVRVYRCMARMCSFVVVVGVAVLGFVFVNTWVQAFRKVCGAHRNLPLHLLHYSRWCQKKLLLLHVVIEGVI